jgi:hypothetical protein
MWRGKKMLLGVTILVGLQSCRRPTSIILRLA